MEHPSKDLDQLVHQAKCETNHPVALLPEAGVKYADQAVLRPETEAGIVDQAELAADKLAAGGHQHHPLNLLGHTMGSIAEEAPRRQ